MDEKEYELTIPNWSAAIPHEWPLEVADAEGVFSSVSGLTIHIQAGTKLRGGPEGLIEGMLQQGFIKEVTHADSQ